MVSSQILSVFLPVALAIIMLGLGLSLSLADFRRVLTYPKAVGVALFCQMLLLPLVCVGVAHLYGLAPALAVGLMLLAASPGGTSANLYSHLAHGDVALNVTLTAINSILAIVMLPLVVNLSLIHFYGEGKVLPLQFDKVIQLFFVVLGPVAVGMWIHSRFPGLAKRAENPVKIASAIFLFAVVALVIITQPKAIAAGAVQVGLAAFTFNVLSLAVGYFVPLIVKLNQRQATAIGMEIGLHNGTLSIAIAMSPTLLNNPEMAMPAAIYGLIAFITAAIFGVLVSRRARLATEEK
ncbi:bile acid:sodium symporter family protein [Stenotrophobium rhamnosiphilum]|uniref:Bile acid:sodium symporter n=1 Tax=Stenotrophobium rhamnosiphilum TaxID=2029166 RepID=A0A2T5MH44_9GAMM|nr:bile acid:sodium symporter family protein [Stenotrophobium rhamnosiphilum]PTU31896.1 bile acid:sodium symporter [Stenotrophobium rhamnosiphilum]